MKILYKNYINNDSVILILRVILGIVFFAHGAQKVLGLFGGYGLENTVGFFEKNLGIPLFFGYLASFTEFFGGIFLLLGFLTRPSAIGIAITMVVAMNVHLPNGFFLPNGIEFTFVLLLVSTAIIISGPGRYSLDKIIIDRFEKKEANYVNN